MRERMYHNRDTSRERARDIVILLSRLGTYHSTMKDTAISFVGNMMAIGHTTASDEVVKNTFANYAFEHYEMAAYMSLLDLLIRLASRPGCRPLIPRLSDQNQWAQSRMP